MRRFAPCALLSCAIACSPQRAEPAEHRDGWQPLFDGSSLAGWHVSARSGHSATSAHRSGGRWRVEEGAIAGSQDQPGNGGLLLTDRSDFGDLELAVEMRNDFGPDSGLFLRATEEGVAYQAHVDYHADGTLMGLYGEGMARGFNHYAFRFLDAPDRIVAQASAPQRAIEPERWREIWRAGAWNELRVRIVGQPPRITTWIGDTQIVDWQDPEIRHPARGAIGLQLHGGGDFTSASVRYRAIRWRPL